MSKFASFRSLTLTALFAAALLSLGGTVRAAESHDNPRYQLWSKFKPGSNATLNGEMDMSGQKVQMTMTTTLVEVTPEKAIVEFGSTMTILGQERKNPPAKQDVPAKDNKAEVKQLGEEEIEAAGKKFKCKVLESDGSAAGQSRGTAKIWVNDSVPGGVVKMTVTAARGGTITYLLKSYEAK